MNQNWQAWYSIVVLLLVPTVSAAADCANTTQVDLCFLIDRSATVCDSDPKFDSNRDTTCDNWLTTVDFVFRFVYYLTIGPNNIRVAVIVFDDNAYLKWGLTGYLNGSRLLDAIETNLEYVKGGARNTSGALNLMADQVFNTNDRPNALKKAIIVTVGPPTDPVATQAAIDRVHSLNITTYVVGNSDDIDTGTLKQLSSPPHMENVTYFLTSTYKIYTMRSQIIGPFCFFPDQPIIMSSTSTLSRKITPVTAVSTSTAGKTSQSIYTANDPANNPSSTFKTGFFQSSSPTGSLSSERISMGENSRQSLTVGLGIAVPCGIVIIMTIIVVVGLTVRSERRFKEETENTQSHTEAEPGFANETVVEPPSDFYAQLWRQDPQPGNAAPDPYVNTSATTDSAIPVHY